MRDGELIAVREYFNKNKKITIYQGLIWQSQMRKSTAQGFPTPVLSGSGYGV